MDFFIKKYNRTTTVNGIQAKILDSIKKDFETKYKVIEEID